MKVSVCIPVYNGEEYIAETIQSVLNQNWQDYELLIVDNHSTDHTLDEVEKFKDSRIKLIKNDRNYGMFENWNICLHKARGEYIQLLCADDRIDPGCLGAKARILDKYQDTVLVFSASYVIDAQGKIILNRRPFHKNLIYDGEKMAKKSFRKGNIYGEPSNVMFRRKSMEKTEGFSNHLFYSGDWEYWIRLSMQGKIAYIDRYLTHFRVSSSSATAGLVRQIKKVRQDDRMFQEKIKNMDDFHVTGMDLLIHLVTVNMRLFAKAVFCLFVNRKYKEIRDA